MGSFATGSVTLKKQDLLPGVCGLSRQVVSYGSGVFKKVSLYSVVHVSMWLAKMKKKTKKKTEDLLKSFHSEKLHGHDRVTRMYF